MIFRVEVIAAIFLFTSGASAAPTEDHELSRDLLVPPPDTAKGDGVYHRLDGDFSLGFSPLAEIDISGQEVRPTILSTLRFYQTVGLGLGLTQSVHSSDPIERKFRIDIIVEPIFLLRWPEYKHSGSALLDLTLDSFGVHAGAAVLEARDPTSSSQTVATFGAGFGVPLMASAEGLWARARLDVELGGASPAVLTLIGLEWQFFFESPWVSSL